MAKYESSLLGNFDELLSLIDKGIIGGSISATFEDGSDYNYGDVRCAVRVYERYSMIGSNRVSLSVTLIGRDDNLFVSVITSGGSQAVFFKLNTFGETSFLDQAANIIEKYKKGK